MSTDHATDAERPLPLVEYCRSCNAPILWLPNSTTGKSAPIDADPIEHGGNVVIEAGRYRVLKKGEATEAGTKRYRSHFATCSQAAQHRK